MNIPSVQHCLSERLVEVMRVCGWAVQIPAKGIVQLRGYAKLVHRFVSPYKIADGQKVVVLEALHL